MQVGDLIFFLGSYSLVGSCMSPIFPQMVSYSWSLNHGRDLLNALMWASHCPPYLSPSKDTPSSAFSEHSHPHSTSNLPSDHQHFDIPLYTSDLSVLESSLLNAGPVMDHESSSQISGNQPPSAELASAIPYGVAPAQNSLPEVAYMDPYTMQGIISVWFHYSIKLKEFFSGFAIPPHQSNADPVPQWPVNPT
jgi:hypothetical protein